jgi:hypothetical protein
MTGLIGHQHGQTGYKKKRLYSVLPLGSIVRRKRQYPTPLTSTKRNSGKYDLMAKLLSFLLE